MKILKSKFRPIEQNGHIKIYKKDCERIQKILKENNIFVSLEEVCSIWEEYSDLYAAGWIILPKEDIDVYGCILEVFDVQDT